MQSSVRTIVAYIVWVYSTTSDPGGATLTWTAETVGHVVNRTRSGVPDVRTACVSRRMRKSCRKAVVQSNELVMLMMIEKPKDEGKILDCIGIVLILWTDLTESLVVRLKELSRLVLFVACWRSSEVMPEIRSARSVPWQQNPAEIEGELVTKLVGSVSGEK